MTRTRLCLALTVLVSLVGCKSAEHQSPGDDHAPHFSYEGETGPSHWGDLSDEWELARTGRRQSPIDLSDPTAEAGPPLQLSYRAAPLEIVNNGHAVQVNYAPGSRMVIDAETFALKQFHFHTPSEHTIDGRQAPMEVHLVHANAAGGLAVLGVMVEEGAENPFLAKFWGVLPGVEGPPEQHADIQVDVSDLLPKSHASYRYSGSLTTPPCSENVDWIVLRTPVQASRAQIAKLHGITGKNARPVQPLNDREADLIR